MVREHDFRLFSVVSIRAPAKGAMGSLAPLQLPRFQFQSAPPRRERFGQRRHDGAGRSVSIRAPAKGAIREVRSRADTTQVSFRAPAKGAMTDAYQSATGRCCFNPRPREGSDGCDAALMVWTIGFQSAPPRRERCVQCAATICGYQVSIRAPAKGAIIWRVISGHI